MFRGVARSRAGKVVGCHSGASGLKRRRQRPVGDDHVKDDRDRARRRGERAAEHGRDVLVRKQPRRGRAQPETGEDPPEVAIRGLAETRVGRVAPSRGAATRDSGDSAKMSDSATPGRLK